MRKYLAEFIAVFTLVFVGAGAIVADEYLSEVRVLESFGFLGIAIAHGLALALAIAAIGHISGGHVNPAVSIAMWVSKRLKFTDLIGYVVAQLAGAVAAAGLLKWIVPKDTFDFAGPGLPALSGVDVSRGTAFEIVLTFFLVLVIWGTAVDGKGPRQLAPFAIGLVLTFDILVGGPFTGAAMNPARWFGPAAIATDFSNVIVWTIGPILGALLASLLYETFLMREPSEEMLMGDVEDELDDEPMTSMASTAQQTMGEARTSAAYTPPPAPPPAGPPPPPPGAPSEPDQSADDR